MPAAFQQPKNNSGALRIAPMSPAFLAEVAGTIAQKDPKQCDQSRPLVDAAVKFQPNHWQSYWVLANCSCTKGRLEKADELYRRAAQYARAPNADLLFSWGVVNEKMGKKSRCD